MKRLERAVPTCLLCKLKMRELSKKTVQFVRWRVVALRYGCLCSTARTFWKIKDIAQALELTQHSVETILTKWRRHRRLDVLLDGRRSNGKKLKFSVQEIGEMTSLETLQQQAPLTLVERAGILSARLRKTVVPMTLFNYYRRHGVRFTNVDLHSTNKLARADEIRQIQREFVDLITERRLNNRPIYWMDETSACYWAPLRKKTWTQGQVRLAYQARRGKNHTVIGAVGGKSNAVQWVSLVCDRTNKDNCVKFIEKLARVARHRLKDILLVTDNHSAHKSLAFRESVRATGMELLFLPPYSSPFSPCEHVWSLFKHLFAKTVSRIQVDYPEHGIEQIMRQINIDISHRLTPAMLRSSDAYLARSLAGELI